MDVPVDDRTMKKRWKQLESDLKDKVLLIPKHSYLSMLPTNKWSRMLLMDLYFCAQIDSS